MLRLLRRFSIAGRRVVLVKPRLDTRTDDVTPGLDRAVVLSQAPDATKEFFRVPRVIGRGEES